ncbi:MAG: biotin--[acetyl-CoA-carboxylase] ligase [Thermoleophilia bacterium]|nr:biotin--[acetyl-CoA-carboxylase] ligase [Thermoleophilia bacterium]
MTRTLAPDRVVPELAGRFGSPYLYRVACASTQRLLAPDLPEGAVAVCEKQTAGRGRLGRTWQAPAGEALLCSVLLRPPPERAAAELSLLGGLAVARLVEGALGSPAGVKWPNDVLVRGHKVAGVLAEGVAGAVVLGIGLNVNQSEASLPAPARVPAASLRTLDGVERDRVPLLAGLLAELERAYDAWRERGLAAVHAELSRRDVLAGQRVRVGSAAGVAAGLDATGALLLDTDGGRLAITSGDVSVDPF